MRDFTNLSALPGHTIVIDGEAYQCPDFQVPGDIQGSVRKIPADRILAVHWHGEHGQGHIEGFGAGERFTDREQIKPYVSAWLKARAKDKAEAFDAILRKKQQMEALVMVNRHASDGLRSDIEAHPDRAAVNRQMLDNLVAEGERMKAAIPTDEQIAAARAEAEAAKREADADTPALPGAK
jgi:hypothetical protein